MNYYDPRTGEEIEEKLIISKVLTTRQVSEMYQIPETTLSKWRSRKIGPRFIKAGRKVLYKQTEIEKFLEDNEKETTSV